MSQRKLCRSNNGDLNCTLFICLCLSVCLSVCMSVCLFWAVNSRAYGLKNFKSVIFYKARVTCIVVPNLESCSQEIQNVQVTESPYYCASVCTVWSFMSRTEAHSAIQLSRRCETGGVTSRSKSKDHDRKV